MTPVFDAFLAASRASSLLSKVMAFQRARSKKKMPRYGPTWPVSLSHNWDGQTIHERNPKPESAKPVSVVQCFVRISYSYTLGVVLTPSRTRSFPTMLTKEPNRRPRCYPTEYARSGTYARCARTRGLLHGLPEPVAKLVTVIPVGRGQNLSGQFNAAALVEILFRSRWNNAVGAARSALA